MNGFAVTLPPLRCRSDIGALVQSVLRQECGKDALPNVSSELITLFQRHPWPGNIRQLANVLRARYLVDVESYGKVEGLPLFAAEVEEQILERLR